MVADDFPVLMCLSCDLAIDRTPYLMPVSTDMSIEVVLFGEITTVFGSVAQPNARAEADMQLLRSIL